MADNASNAIKELGTRLNNLDRGLTDMHTHITQIFQDLKSQGINLGDIFAAIEKQTKSADKAHKIELIAEMVDKNGKPLSKDYVSDFIKNLEDNIKKKITSPDQIKKLLDDYKTYLALLKKSNTQIFDMVNKPVQSLLGGNTKNLSEHSRQRIENEKEVQQLQEKATQALQRRKELEEQIAKIPPDSGSSKLKELKAEWEKINKEAQNYLTQIASRGTAGARAMKGLEVAGLLDTADTNQIKLERQQIDLLRQRMQAEQQLQRFLQQKQNAQLAGKQVSPRVDDSIARLQDRISTIDKQRLHDITGFTQTSLQRIEGMWQNHETALTRIKEQGEQSRKRIEERETTRVYAEQIKQVVDLLRQQLQIQKELDKLKLAPQQTQQVTAQIANLTTQYNNLGNSIKAIANGNQEIIRQAEQQISGQKQAQTNAKATADAMRESKAQEKAYNEAYRQTEREYAEQVKQVVALLRQQLQIQKELDRLNNAPKGQAVSAQIKELTTQYQQLSEQIRQVAGSNQKLISQAQQQIAAQRQAAINAHETTQAINAQRQEAKRQAAIQKKADSESLANQRRQIQIKSQLAAIDKNRPQHIETLSRKERALLAQQQAEYRALQSELSKLIARQKQLNAISHGSNSRAKGLLQTYEISESEKALRRYEEQWRRVNQAQKDSHADLSKLVSTVQRLGYALGITFSTQGLVNFGKKIVETRGTFEMQFVAMKQIIGDVDQATNIWNKTLQAALQSPFTTMQLTDYTKRLAAYRIETEKLFDTTKRLADVSAGLGVDMGRLILAYGQVKTANYLRASEVRQFTEAGVNIYGELAKYFSELEGHAVSTSDVVERVTKRMVLFSDVEEVFKRMTDEGGTFYDMQRVQADTVRGQISKLRDAYDQMLNTIGEANQGTIRDFVESLNSMVRHWRDVASFIMKNVNALVVLLPFIVTYRMGAKLAAAETYTWSAAMKQIKYELTLLRGGFAGFNRSVTLGTAAVRIFKGSVELAKTALRTFAPFLVIEGLMLLVNKLQESSRAAKQFKEDLRSIITENTSGLNDEISRFDLLREKIESANEGTQERRDLMQQMNMNYGEYLGNINQETATAQELAAAYDQVAEKIRNTAQARVSQQMHERAFKESLDIQNEITDQLTDHLKIFNGQSGYFRPEKREVQDIARNYIEGVLNGSTESISDIIKKYYNVDYFTLKPFNERSYKKRLNKISETLTQSQDSMFDSVYETKEERERAEKNQDLYNKAKEAEENRYNEAIEELNQHKLERAVINLAIEEEEKRHRKKLIDIANKFNMPSPGEVESLTHYEEDYNERLAEALGFKGPLSTDAEIIERYGRLVSNIENTQQGSGKRDEQIAESLKRATENLDKLKSKRAAGGDISEVDKNGVEVKTAEMVIAEAEQEIRDWKLAVRLRGISLKNKKGSSIDYKSISSLVSLLKEMNSEYDKLSKSAYGYTRSQEKVTESFTSAFDEIFGFLGMDISQADTWSKQGLANTMQTVLDKMDEGGLWGKFGKDGGKKARQEFLKAMGEALSEVDIEAFDRIREDFGRQMEDALGNYELTLDLQKLNLPKGLAAELWGIEETDLSDLRGILSSMYEGLKDENGELSGDAMKQYEDYLKKIDDLERKQQRERLKDYAKYLEYQYGERVKLEMDYVKKIAQLEAETGLTQTQKNAIREGIDNEYKEKSRDQDWKDFKGSEFYVQMMEDLERHSTASLEVMRKRLIEMRENAESLSPRALKEVVNALEKIDKMEAERKDPFARWKDAVDAIKGTDIKEVYKNLAEQQEQLAGQEEEQRNLESMIALEEERNKLEAEGVTLEEARVKLSQLNSTLLLAQKAYNNFQSSGTKQDEKTKTLLEEALNKAKTDVEVQNEIIRILSGQSIIDQREAGNPFAGKSLSYLTHRRKSLKDNIEVLQKDITKQEELVKKQKELDDATQAMLESLSGWAQSFGNVFGGVMDSVDYFTDQTYGMTDAWKEFGSSSVSAFSDLVSGIQAYKKANTNAEKEGGNGITGLFSAQGLQLALVVLSVLIKIIQAIAKQHDAALDKQIQIQQERIDDLSRAYERLEKAIERTFDSVSYMRVYNHEVANLHEQISALEAQLVAEEAKKNTDTSAIRQYRDDIQEAYDKLDELEQKQVEVFGGIGKDSYRSAAEEFVSAWKDAFLETGDGLSGLQDHFDEFLQDWFVKQATMRIAGNMLNPLFEQIDRAVDKYGTGGVDVMMNELANIREQTAAIFPGLSAALEDFAGMWNLEDEGGLSGLAAGIQGITEEQANVLEGYWNSVRMYTASIDSNVSRIAQILGVGGAETNPMLSQLNAIARNTASIPSIYSLLQSLQTNNGNGRAFRAITV